MKHRIHYLVALAFLCLSTLSLYAHDFEAKNADGVTIYYNKLSDTECEVTYKGFSYYDSDYSGSISIPASVNYKGNTLAVTSIGNNALHGCYGLTSISLPESLTCICDYAFQWCYKLTSVTLSEGLTSIGTGAFEECSVLNSITLPKSLTSIGDEAFSWCGELGSITIPEAVSSIGCAVFDYCHSLSSVTVDPANPYYSSLDGVLFNKDQSILVYYPGGKELSDYILPNTVTSICDRAFGECNSLCSITLPAGLTSFGNQELSDCVSFSSINVDPANPCYSSLDGVLFDKEQTTLICYPCAKELSEYTLPESVTTIGDAAFRSCYPLTSITLPEGLTSIGKQAFEFCGSLVSLTLPEGVTSIDENTFYFCTSLTSISLPEGVTSIGDYAFSYCTSLDSIALPKSLYHIDDNAFNYCTSLESITLPEGVNYIGNYAFSSCESLTSITLPEGRIYIGDGAFWDCISLTSFTNLAIEPELIEDFVFDDVPLANATLYVPAGSIEAYKNAPVWKDFGRILDVESKSDDTSIGTLYQESTPTVRFDLMGRRINKHTSHNIRIEQGKKSLVR